MRWAAATRSEESVDVPKSPSVIKVTREKQKLCLRDRKVGFIGWGAMAQALSLGILREEITDVGQIMVTDIVPEMTKAAQKAGLHTTTSDKEVAEWADIVVIATKPQSVDQVLAHIQPSWKAEKLLVSICAGITIEAYQKGLGPETRVVRVMPNTPALVGESATAYAGSLTCEDLNLDLVHEMFGAVGHATHRVPESLLDAVTGLSGSGPAFVYMLIQALSDAGVHGGLPRAVALSLATQTVVGAARMVQDTKKHPMVLKEAVTSPAGTTIAGVRTLEKMGFSSAIFEAVEAARVRSEELGKKPK